jgi:hypothetical protein
MDSVKPTANQQRNNEFKPVWWHFLFGVAFVTYGYIMR